MKNLNYITKMIVKVLFTYHLYTNYSWIIRCNKFKRDRKERKKERNEVSNG